MLKVVWRGQAVFVVRRVKAVIDQLGNHDDMLADPKSEDSVQPALYQGDGRGTGAKSRVLGGSRRVHALGLLAVGRLLAERFVPSRGCRSRCELARRLLLPLPRFEIRFVGPRVQKHAGAEEFDRAAVRIRREYAHRHRRRRRCQIRLVKQEVSDGRSTRDRRHRQRIHWLDRSAISADEALERACRRVLRAEEFQFLVFLWCAVPAGARQPTRDRDFPDDELQAIRRRKRLLPSNTSCGMWSGAG